MAYRIRNVQKILAKARACKVMPTRIEGVYRVFSPRKREPGDAPFYLVDVYERSCTCPRQEYISVERNGGVNACSHVQAGMIRHWVGEGYWLIAAADTEEMRRYVTDTLHRKVVEHAIDLDLLGSDGVFFYARRDERPELHERRSEPLVQHLAVLEPA